MLCLGMAYLLPTRLGEGLCVYLIPLWCVLAQKNILKNSTHKLKNSGVFILCWHYKYNRPSLFVEILKVKTVSLLAPSKRTLLEADLMLEVGYLSRLCGVERVSVRC